MSQNSGTLVIAPIRVNDSADTYPSAYASEILGGWKAAADATARAAIPALRLETGCVCFQVDTLALYRWDGAAWQAFTFTIADGSITLAKLATQAAHTFLGNDTGSTASPTALSITSMRSEILPVQGEDGRIPGTLANATTTICLYASAAMTLTFLKTQLSAGTATVSLKINGTTVTGSSVSATTSIVSGTLTTLNTVAAGDKIEIVVASVSSAADLDFTVLYTYP